MWTGPRHQYSQWTWSTGRRRAASAFGLAWKMWKPLRSLAWTSLSTASLASQRLAALTVGQSASAPLTCHVHWCELHVLCHQRSQKCEAQAARGEGSTTPVTNAGDALVMTAGNGAVHSPRCRQSFSSDLAVHLVMPDTHLKDNLQVPCLNFPGPKCWRCSCDDISQWCFMLFMPWDAS